MFNQQGKWRMLLSLLIEHWQLVSENLRSCLGPSQLIEDSGEY